MLSPIRSAITPNFIEKSQIHFYELLSAFEFHQTNIDVLSLDCFDTIIFRNTAAPQDVFFTLQHKPVFQTLGLTPTQRMVMEDKSRGFLHFKKKSTEIKLTDLYRYIDVNIDNDKLNALIEEEISSEIEHCYAHPLMIELMRLAKEKNKKIIIVSDIYYSCEQLKKLLEHKLPLDVFHSIDKIYCSCDYGESKSQGLFKQVIQDLAVPPTSILHIGDNPTADKEAPKQQNIKALHLQHVSQTIDQLYNMYAWAGSFINPAIRYSRPLYHPFRGMMTTLDFQQNQAEKIIGASLGAIMYAFAAYLKNEIAMLKEEGKKVKILFLMRDAYLPSLACYELMGDKCGQRVCISRFATYAASFLDEDDVMRYLAEVAASNQFQDICNQLLLPQEISNRIIEQIEKSQNKAELFVKNIMQQDVLQCIFMASSAYRKRLLQYLKKIANIQSGETLVFVDLGYSATSQQKLSAILQIEFNVDVIGRYLLALSSPNWQHNRKGLLDPSKCDDRALTMLVKYIGMIEQLCTSTEKSVVDYDDQGNPIFSSTTVSSKQHDKLKCIQSACIDFIKQAETFINSSNIVLDQQILSDFVSAELCRLIYLPTELEIQYLESFQFDFNLGTKTLLDVFDVEKGLSELRRRGLFFMEKDPKKMRTNYPAELRAANLELSFLLMSMERFKGKITANELSLRREILPVILVSGHHSLKNTISAFPTHDGYFSALIPLGKGNFQIGVQFGKLYRWLEVESAELIDADTLFTHKESERTQCVDKFLIADQMMKRDVGLYECVSEAAFLAFIPSNNFTIQNQVLRLIFRPIVRRL